MTAAPPGPPTLSFTPATPTPPTAFEAPSTTAGGAVDTPPPPPAQRSTLLTGAPFELELLLVSGLRRKWTFGAEEAVGEAKRRVWAEWPEEWLKAEPRPPTVDHLRFLYLGRFLDDSKPLSSYGLPPSSSSAGDEPDAHLPGPKIVHLHIRTLAPPPNDLKSRASAKKCGCCIVS
ncbi:hypothetical protein JCM6882_006262 [Rhodosporidiobolus microsporus]